MKIVDAASIASVNGDRWDFEPAARPGPARVHPRHRAIVAVDVENSTLRADSAKADLRGALYRLLEGALDETGIAKRHRDPFVDRGDGILTLIHPHDEVPKTLLPHFASSVLAAALTEHNSGPAAARIRLRVVVHAGEVHYDDRGCFGEALDIAFRLLDSPETKETLRRTTSPLVLVVSEDVYHSVVRHCYAENSYLPLVNVNVAGRRHQGWVRP